MLTDAYRHVVELIYREKGWSWATKDSGPIQHLVHVGADAAPSLSGFFILTIPCMIDWLQLRTDYNYRIEISYANRLYLEVSKNITPNLVALTLFI